MAINTNSNGSAEEKATAAAETNTEKAPSQKLSKAEAQKKAKAEAEKKAKAEAEKRKKAEAEKKAKAEAAKKAKIEAQKKAKAEAEKKKKAEAEKKKKAEAEKRKKIEAEKKKKADKKKAIKEVKYLSGAMLRKMAFGGAFRLQQKTDKVNKLNVFPVPDGDTGDNMRMTIESGISAIENLDSNDLAEVMKVFSHGMLLGARGNSGVILSQFFSGVSEGFETTHKASPKALGNALEMGVKKAYASVLTPTEGTILSVARESVAYAVERITPESTIRTFFADLVKEMYDAVDRTPEALEALREAGVVDSGGAGLFFIMEGFNRVLNGQEIKKEDVISESKAQAPVSEYAFGPDSVMTYGYCTELLVQLQNSKCDIDNFNLDALKDFLVNIGDSVVTFKTESIVKIHVHTLTPERVLAHMREFGEFLAVKIENMSVQHTELEEKKSEAAPSKEEPKKAEKKKYGSVAVANGPGIEELFRELGVDEIIHGGQTQNPSTNDFLDAFTKINAENIFVFPNNGNIVMAAGQAAELYTDARIHVIPVKNTGTGYVAISCLDFSKENAEDILKDLDAAIARVTAGYVSPSIRDADMNGVHINNGDTIGVIEKEIVLSESDRRSVALQLADKLLSLDGKFMLTVFVGSDVAEEERAELEEKLYGMNSDAEIYFINGGQEIYPYVFVAE